jgi:endogenous inhibitor of DNA gyrase (YacG/DUF329 family)
MIIPCALCKISYKRSGVDTATEIIPFCSKCCDDYSETLKISFEKVVETIDDYNE